MIARRFISRLLFRVCIGTTALSGVNATLDEGPETHFVDLREYLPENEARPYKSRSESKVVGCVGHHTASRGSSFKRIAEYHTMVKNWGGISYTMGVNWEGTIYLLNYFTTLSYHTSGHNTEAVSIVCLGNFSVVTPRPELEKGFKRAYNYMDERFDFEYFSMHTTIKSYSQGLYTECPGVLNYGWMSGMEFDVRPYPDHIEGLPFEPLNTDFIQ